MMRTAPRARQGFTLVEMLVVVGIIAALMALLVPAVMRALTTAEEKRVVGEINDLKIGLQTFHSTYGRFPPSRITLVENGPRANYGPSALILESMFPGIDLNARHDWNGDGAFGGTYDLQGDECLVYFVGGIPRPGSPNAVSGFNRDKTNPTAPSSTRSGPFSDVFNGKGSRLVSSGRNGGRFLVFNDEYGAPYAYFVAGNATMNNYNLNNDMGGRARPYFTSQSGGSIIYHQPKGYQIISAGPDKSYGGGGLWVKDGASALSPTDMDNVTNFSGGMLRYGQ